LTVTTEFFLRITPPTATHQQAGEQATFQPSEIQESEKRHMNDREPRVTREFTREQVIAVLGCVISEKLRSLEYNKSSLKFNRDEVYIRHDIEALKAARKIVWDDHLRGKFARGKGLSMQDMKYAEKQEYLPDILCRERDKIPDNDEGKDIYQALHEAFRYVVRHRWRDMVIDGAPIDNGSYLATYCYPRGNGRVRYFVNTAWWMNDHWENARRVDVSDKIVAWTFKPEPHCPETIR
jgi:hypothetical protein